MANPDIAIFLADVSDSLRKRKRQLITVLEEHGHAVLTDIPPPHDEAGHDRRVVDVLQRVSLSVHLLDGVAGREIEGREDRTYLQKQVDLALEHAPSILVWTPRDLDIAEIDDEMHQKFLARLKRDERVADFIRSAPSDIGHQVLETMKRLATATAETTADSCLLVTQDKDLNPFLQVATALGTKGITPLIIQESTQPKSVMQLYDERLRQVAHLIIIYGEVAGDWVRERLTIAIKLAAIEDLTIKMGVFAPIRPPQETNFSRGVFQVQVLRSVDDTLAFLGNPDGDDG